MISELTMSRQINRSEGKTTLRVRCTEVTGASVLGEGSRDVSSSEFCETPVVRNVEWLHRRFLETLGSVPGHVLDGCEGTVHEEEKVQPSVADDGVVGALDDTG